jgi:LysR family glycine cleavage system transcriptional activator
VFDYYGQALQAAADGVGIAMGIRPYIDDDLQAGRLVTPFSLTVPKGQQWYLIYRDIRRDQPDFVTFRKWIIAATGNKSIRQP